MIRIGLAGAGWVSEHHLDAWATLRERARVVAIADPRLDAAEARAARYDIPRVYSSAEDMLAEVQLEALDIAAPREQHVPLCRLAAQRGLAILCQKPLAPTLQEAEALVAELGQIRLMVHENWRFRPHYRLIRSWLQQGRIGDVRTVLLTLFTSGLLPDANGQRPALVRQPSLASLERMLLMEVLIHHIDVLRFLLGPLTLEAARLGKSCDAIRGEDRAALLLSGAQGATLCLLGDFMAHGYPPEQMDHLEIFGTEGAIRLRGSQIVVSGHSEKTVTLDLAENYRASYRGALTHFVDRLLDGGEFETNPADNLETLRIVEAAYALNTNED